MLDEDVMVDDEDNNIFDRLIFNFHFCSLISLTLISFEK